MEQSDTGSQVEQLQAALIAEKFSHALDLIKDEQRLINTKLERLEKTSDDHETRLRSATEGVTQFKVWSGLTAGGAGIVSIIALLRTFLGG